jgi:hypothetical protein
MLRKQKLSCSTNLILHGAHVAVMHDPLVRVGPDLTLDPCCKSPLTISVLFRVIQFFSLGFVKISTRSFPVKHDSRRRHKDLHNSRGSNFVTRQISLGFWWQSRVLPL